jgi:hypothetical protein
MGSTVWLVAITEKSRGHDRTHDFSLGGQARVVSPDELKRINIAGAIVYLHANNVRGLLKAELCRQIKSHGRALGWRFVLFTGADFRLPELDDFEGEPVFTWGEVESAFPGTPAVRAEIGVLLSVLCQGYLIAHSARYERLYLMKRALDVMGWTWTYGLERQQDRANGASKFERQTEEPGWWRSLPSRNMTTTLNMLASENGRSAVSSSVRALVQAIFSQNRLAEVSVVAKGFLGLHGVSSYRQGGPRTHDWGALPQSPTDLVLLYSYADRRLAKGICQVLRTLGVRPKLQNMSVKLSLPPAESGTWVLWSSSCGASLAREFLLKLDADVALRTPRSLSFVNVNGISSSLTDYLEDCGARRVVVHRLARGLREFGTMQFVARRIVYGSNLGQEVRKTGHGYQELRQYSKHLKNILCGFRGKVVTIPKLIRSAFRN